MPSNTSLAASHNAHDPAGFFGFNSVGVIETPTCYCRGTRILTAIGDVPVENLEIGDWVITASGTPQKIRWIGRRSYAARMIAGKKSLLPIRLRAGSIAEKIPERDLLLSPTHAIFIDGILIPAHALVNGVSITQEDQGQDVEYFHIELDRHDVLIAEGTPAESFIDDHHGRSLFHNAAEYAALYPDALPEPAISCAPRHESGPQVDAVWQTLARRSGLFGRHLPGLVTGAFQLASNRHVRGWVRHSAQPGLPICLDIRVRGKLTQQVLADIEGKHAGWAQMPAGARGFVVELPAGLTQDDLDTLAITCSAYGAPLAREEMRAAA